jgi:hypothetical protein
MARRKDGAFDLNPPLAGRGDLAPGRSGNNPGSSLTTEYSKELKRNSLEIPEVIADFERGFTPEVPDRVEDVEPYKKAAAVSATDVDEMLTKAARQKYARQVPADERDKYAKK